MVTWEWRKFENVASFIVTSSGLRLRYNQPVITFHCNCSAISFSIGQASSSFLKEKEKESGDY